MKRKDFLAILIPSFVFVCAWVIFSIIHSYLTPTVSQTINKHISPIDPNFDIKTISDIKERKAIEPIYEITATTINLNSKQATKSATQVNNLNSKTASDSADTEVFEDDPVDTQDIQDDSDGIGGTTDGIDATEDSASQ